MGTCTLAVTEIEDDLGQNDDSAMVILSGDGRGTGRIEMPLGVDWFEVSAEEGDTYRIRVNGSGDEPLNDPNLAGIYDSDASKFYIAAAARGKKIRDAQEIGEYTVQVTAIQVSEPAGDDFASNTTTRDRVLVCGSVTGSRNTGFDHEASRVKLWRPTPSTGSTPEAPTPAAALWLTRT